MVEIDFIHSICCIFDIQTIKLFIVFEMNLRGYSRSSAMSSFIRSPSIRDWRSRLHLLSEKTADMTLKVDQGPDLQNIIRQSYDKVMTITEVMTNHTTDAIYKKSYDKVKINL